MAGSPWIVRLMTTFFAFFLLFDLARPIPAIGTSGPGPGDQAGPAARRPVGEAPNDLVTATRSRPNIVVLMLDDVGADDGRVWQRLPTIRRRFVEDGIAFTDFHGETPACCPGRVGFLTGLHTHAHGVTRNDGTLFQPAMSLATQLQRAGYYTILGGKYLNDYTRVEPKVPPGWSEFHAMEPGYYDYPMWSNGRRRSYGRRTRDYSTDVVARKIVGSLDRAPRGQPVFVWAAPWASHMPRLAARRHLDDPRCKGIPRWSPPGYMELAISDKPAYVRRQRLANPRGMSFEDICRPLLAVDDLLRQVERKLADQGRLGRTLFVLTSDNGMNYGMHRLVLDKKTPYATQLPFFVSWPARLDPGRPDVSERLQNIDFAPTVCELVGCRLGPYPTGQLRPDGVSFAGVLTGAGKPPSRRAVLASFRSADAKVPRWYGVETTRFSPLARRLCATAGEGGCLWSYVRYETGEAELYDLSNGPCWGWQTGDQGDPCRLRNLAGRRRYRDIQVALRRELAALRKP